MKVVFGCVAWMWCGERWFPGLFTLRFREKDINQHSLVNKESHSMLHSSLFFWHLSPKRESPIQLLVGILERQVETYVSISRRLHFRCQKIVQNINITEGNVSQFIWCDVSLFSLGKCCLYPRPPVNREACGFIYLSFSFQEKSDCFELASIIAKIPSKILRG